VRCRAGPPVFPVEDTHDDQVDVRPVDVRAVTQQTFAGEPGLLVHVDGDVIRREGVQVDAVEVEVKEREREQERYRLGAEALPVMACRADPHL
jgi:hypothetical protein